MSGKRLLFAAFLLMPGVLSACAPRLLHNAPPVDLHERAEPAGFSQIRFWADDRPRDADALIEQRASLMKQRFADAIVAGKPVELSFLALSGGGADGAFGAGLLNGWTEHGTRPEFEVVTGVSTGALIAPFAFLGPEWDDELEEVYTTMTTESLLVPQILQGLIGGAALTNSLPFRRTIEKYATEEMLHSIAAEHRNGRRLFVGTTALDAARPVVWNIGAIAESGVPGSLKLFHDILQASASIPGAFPPVLIEVEIDGKRYNELHVDGGVTSQVFAYPAQIESGDFDRVLPLEIKRTVYVIRNSTLRPSYENVRPRLLPLTRRSIGVLIAYQGIGDLYRIASRSKRDGIGFKLTSIPETWDLEREEVFDPVYMTALFEFGEQMARVNIPWRETVLPASENDGVNAAN